MGNWWNSVRFSKYYYRLGELAKQKQVQVKSVINPRMNFFLHAKSTAKLWNDFYCE